MRNQGEKALTLQKSKVLASFRTNLYLERREFELRVSRMSQARMTRFVELWMKEEMVVVASLPFRVRDNEDLRERHGSVWQYW